MNPRDLAAALGLLAGFFGLMYGVIWFAARLIVKAERWATAMDREEERHP